MSSSALLVSGISKVYRIGAPRAPYLTLRDSIAGAAMQVVRQVARAATGAAAYRTRSEALWALTDVTFEVNQGACFGIIGRNGAGKTTVLKILSRITPPTAGQIICHGRVASLLGVGTGFHPELTGRENIFLNGTLLGMTRAEVRRKFDEIVAFAEIEQFLETPVKRYSSGMYVRLAFAVAAHLEPEILVVDEVLAVGDAAFQKKCLGKMEDVASHGRTVLFVSHNMAVIAALCKQAVLLERGRVVTAGRADEVVRAYLAKAAADGITAPAYQTIAPAEHDPAWGGTSRIAFRAIRLVNHAYPTFTVHWKESIALEIEFAVQQPARNVVFSVTVATLAGVGIFRVQSNDAGGRLFAFEPGLHRISLVIENALQSGNYVVELGSTTAVGHVPLGRVAKAAGLEVLDVAAGEHVAPQYSGQLVNGAAQWAEPVRC